MLVIIKNLRPYYSAIVFMLIITIAAVAGVWLTASNMRNAARQQFIAAADVGIGEIENDIKSDKSDGQSIAQSYLIAAQQSRASRADYQPRLRLLYDNISRRDADLAMVGVALRVAGPDRAAYEQALTHEMGKPISITAMDETGAMDADTIRNEYFPITFIEPQNTEESHIGMNIAADSAISKAMKQAKETGFPTVSGTLMIQKGNQAVNGYCVVVPIIATGQTEKDAQIIGYVIEYDSFANLIAEVFKGYEDFAGLVIFDSSAPRPSKPIANAGNAFTGESLLSEMTADSSNYSKIIKLTTHNWTIVAIPNPVDPISVWLLIMLGIANAAFIILIAMYMFSSIRRSLALEAVEANLRISYAELSVLAEKAEKTSTELKILREISEMLQVCENTGEVFLGVSSFIDKLFWPYCGAIYLLNNDRTVAEVRLAWGKQPPKDKAFAYHDCIALRHSDAYLFDKSASVMMCPHVKNEETSSYICLPMTAQDGVFGLFYLADCGPGAPLLEREDHVLATTVSEQLAMTLANITLRERLREQAVTDHLTNLFNRRFMEDMLEREIRRADRNGQSIGFIMLDIDFFKNVNDTYGHDAGDRVLETLGVFLKTSVRMEDIACRYGGEEFLLVMPGSDRKNTLKRAKDIIERVQLLTFESDGQTLPTIHLSGGVSIYPDHAKDKDQIVIKADEALYKAKKTGRNKIVVWAEPKK